MKIPETSANVGAYYGNDENGQWQPNGMLMDGGVGGGVVGSGDAGAHRPVFAHLPPARAGPGPHIPGTCYVMAGAYYPAGPYPGGAGGGGPPGPGMQPDDFADYMWMENEEEFDKQVMQQLEEEALMEQCIEAMLEDEQRERRTHSHTHARARARNGHNQHYPTTSNGNPSLSLEETVSRSTLNPLAAEFVPTRHAPPAPPAPPPPAPAHTEEKPESPPEEPAVQEAPKASEEETPAPEPEPEPSATDGQTTPEVVDSKTEEPVTTEPEPPEVSAADVQPDKSRLKDSRKDTKKQQVKQETKKSKPQVVRSDTKVQPKKKEVRSVRSEVKVEDRVEETTVIAPAPAVVELVKPQPSPEEKKVEEPAQAGPKPINYAAAAKANKPKKPTSPPAVNDKAPTVRVVEKSQDKKPKTEKSTVKTEKPIQRKNSAK